jgi:hypothetical protein
LGVAVGASLHGSRVAQASARAHGSRITTAVVRQEPINGRYRAQCATTGCGRIQLHLSTVAVRFVDAIS